MSEVVNGRAGGLAGSGSDYEITVIPAAEGTVVVRSYPKVWQVTPPVLPEPGVRAVSEEPSGPMTVPGDGPGFDVWDRDVRGGRATGRSSTGNNQTQGSQATSPTVMREPPARRSGTASCSGSTGTGKWRGLKTVAENPSRSAAAQRKALIMSAEGKTVPPPVTSDWACYTEVPRIGGGENHRPRQHRRTRRRPVYAGRWRSNNLRVGHRRQILSPFVDEIGTGNVYDEDGSRRPANAMHFGYDYSGDAPVREPRGFVAWPPAGYVPAGTVWGRWSFQLPEADFTRATVSVTDDYGPIPVNVIRPGQPRAYSGCLGCVRRLELSGVSTVP